MTDQHSSRPAVQHTTRTVTGSVTTEIYEAAFSTTGEHPQCGIAIARTLHEARHRLADTMIFTRPEVGRPPRTSSSSNATKPSTRPLGRDWCDERWVWSDRTMESCSSHL